MKHSHLTLILTLVPWSMLVIGISLTVFISMAPENSSNLPTLLLAYLCGIVPLLLIGITWLMLSHRRVFTNGPGWMITVIWLIGSSLPATNQPTISLLLITSVLLSNWAIGVATAILLWHRDLGLQLLGWVPVVYLWALVIAWRFQGNPIELWIQGLNNPGEGTPLWWLNSLWCVVGWVIPISILSIIAHTVRLLWREFRDQSSLEEQSVTTLQ